jgi:hypothetical protein
MKNRNLVLGSVASFVLVGVVLSTAPSIAQSLPRESTPAERAQTEDLNAQQASEPDIIIAARTDEHASVPPDVAAYNAQVAQANAAAEAKYNSQLKDYQDKKQAYEQQNQNYQQQLGAYKDELANPPVVVEEHHVIVEQPAVVTAAPVFPGKSLIDLNILENPDREIAGFPVADRAGYVVGHFRHMTFQDGGREKAVITLNNNKTVAVTDDHLRLDPDRDTVVADLTYDELNSMPARF